jgi:hypothetical protein
MNAPSTYEACQCEWSSAHFNDDSNGKPQTRTMHAYGDAVANGPSVVFIGRICQTCADAGHDRI